MEKRQDKEDGFFQEKKNMLKLREKKWATLFNKYDGMNEVEEEEDEVLSDYSERELTSNDSYSLELEEVDNIEEEEEEDNLSNADSVVEVSDEDEEAANFKAAFKEIAQNSIKIMEKTYEEHFSNDIKTKNKIQSIRKSIKSSEKSATATMAATPIIASNAIQGIENMCKSNTNGNETSMALVKPMPDVSLQEPFSSAISTCTKLIKKGDIVYKEEVTTTTNVITTTTTKTKFTIIKQNADDQDECNTPKKVNLAKLPKSGKKKRPSNEPVSSTFSDYDDDDFNTFTTPTSNRRKSRVFNTPSSTTNSSSFVASGKCVEILLTPGSKNIVSRKEIHAKLEGTVPNSAKMNSRLVRNIRADKDKRLSLMITPPPKAIMPADSSEDGLIQLKIRQRPLLVKACDDTGFSVDK